jgi:hypothetical protein
VRIFKDAWFARFAKREGIGDDELKAIVDDMGKGLCGRDLGGGVYKQRLARAGAGKSGGYRVILFFKRGGHTFFVYGFAKSDMENIRRSDLKELKIYAKEIFGLQAEQIEERLNRGSLKEIL